MIRHGDNASESWKDLPLAQIWTKLVSPQQHEFFMAQLEILK